MCNEKKIFLFPTRIFLSFVLANFYEVSWIPIAIEVNVQMVKIYNIQGLGKKWNEMNRICCDEMCTHILNLQRSLPFDVKKIKAQCENSFIYGTF